MPVRLRFVVGMATLAAAGVVASAQAPSPQSPAPLPDTPPALLDPSRFTEQAPDTYRAVFDTSVGMFIIKVTRAWAPHGADRFYNLVKGKYYDGNRFFRVIEDFVAQWGIHGDPAVSAAWEKATLPPDRALMSNTRGRVTFAQGNLASSRTTQVFINFRDNSRLDINGFAPFGEVVTSLVLVERLYHRYGEGIDQGAIIAGGNALLAQTMPRLDYVKTAVIETK